MEPTSRPMLPSNAATAHWASLLKNADTLSPQSPAIKPAQLQSTAATTIPSRWFRSFVSLAAAVHRVVALQAAELQAQDQVAVAAGERAAAAALHRLLRRPTISFTPNRTFFM